ncbi:hypothetical protein BRAO375_2640003 [Bradyrhizobium sp. ORS 375]|uniref:hypothetical protein n=1 Tax=Bradyrhizobium sp. (strain ORS 375) TaxID=566679 RepID=UPI000240AD57|nr:hypothetical protein [Bradyrhizobium sp. ORS 375]CCD93488.1 hypothetical protein BRAO375_2640003 [Bradyrhizobium sp. ORS 375]
MVKTASRPVRPRHAALCDRESEGSSPGNGRTSGPDGMADPDTHWDLVAEASDESFPCSDSPSWSAVRVGNSIDRE